MDADFVRDRITELRLKKNISERELSFALNKAGNYINNITSGKALPLMKNFFDICNYFYITPFKFFYPNAEYPLISQKIYDELKRLSNDDLSEFLFILEIMNPLDYSTFISFLNRYKWNKERLEKNKNMF